MREELLSDATIWPVVPWGVLRKVRLARSSVLIPNFSRFRRPQTEEALEHYPELDSKSNRLGWDSLGKLYRLATVLTPSPTLFPAFPPRASHPPWL